MSAKNKLKKIRQLYFDCMDEKITDVDFLAEVGSLVVTYPRVTDELIAQVINLLTLVMKEMSGNSVAEEREVAKQLKLPATLVSEINRLYNEERYDISQIEKKLKHK